MIEWIKKHLDPPGMERKNLRSIFSFIGRVFGIVKDDAIKAHNAFFPYLCDEDKLRQHGNSLMIPELPFDTEKNYRDRVATASFYLMRAGERAYINEQLQAYLGSRYIISDEFLKVFLKISELSTEERIWAYSFLDGILDPNILFDIDEWFSFVENIETEEESIITAKQAVTEEYFERIKHNGIIVRDGKKRHNSYNDNEFLYLNIKSDIVSEEYHGQIYRKKSFKRNGTIRHNNTNPFVISDVLSVGMRYHRLHNGKYQRNKRIQHNGNILIPLME
jgi:uncharacterized protein YpiB (UPF0302 family)